MKLKNIISTVRDDQKPAFVRKKWRIHKKFREKESTPPSIIRKDDKELSLFGDKGA